MNEKEAQDLIDEFNETNLFVLHFTTGFDPKARFSAVTLNLERTSQSIPLNRLLNWNGKCLAEDKPHFRNLAHVINTNETLVFESPIAPEITVVKQLAVLTEIASEVFLEYRNGIEQCPNVQAKHLGMGSAQTWHGTPDVRVRGMSEESDIILLG